MTTTHRSTKRSHPGSHRVAAALLISTLAGTTLAGCGSDAERTQPATVSGRNIGDTVSDAKLNWGKCPAPAAGQTRDPHLACGTLTVPLNYQDPDGTQIEIAVSRLSTAKPGERRGVLLLNPGGPALGGFDMPETMASSLPKSVLDRYDLIGFDPRGVEYSTPQSCGLKDPTVTGLFPYPAAAGSITKNVAIAKADAAQCATAVGKTLQYYTTANTARDMDRIREALGENKISYWGQSYGTYLGAVYRSLFPSHTDRMILEGDVDPTGVWAVQVANTWGQGMADRFPDGARVAAAQNSTLELGANVTQVTDTYLALADRLDRTPAVVPGASASLDGAMLRNVTYALLLHNNTLPLLAEFWKAAEDLSHGSTSAADTAVLNDVFADSPNPPGVPADNQATMFLALSCGDAEWSHDVNGYATRTAANRKRWPLTAGMPANIWACAFWSKPAEPPVAIVKGGARNTLILQNRRDNATPWESGLGMHAALGSGSVFVGVDNGGHYVYDEGSACADTITVRFLATGRLPDKDVYCTDVKQN